MAGSKKRPLLSGYYRLMEIALQLGNQSGLFSTGGDTGQVTPLTFPSCLPPVEDDGQRCAML